MIEDLKITPERFVNEIAEKFTDYIVQIKLKYNHEIGYRYETTLLLYDCNLDAFVWYDDFDEGEEDIRISDYMDINEVFD